MHRYVSSVLSAQDTGNARRLMIRCSKTGRLVPTGVSMDKPSFISSKLAGDALQCPECGLLHRWTKADARLE